MKRLILIASLVLGLSFVAAPVATSAAPSDAQGPACGNITNGEGTYTSTGGVDFTVSFAKPTCSFVTYTFTVTDTSGNTITPVSSTSSTDCTPDTAGGGCIHYVDTLPSGSPTVVCLSAATYIQGHLVDLAPNTSPSTFCLVQDGSGASGNFG